PVTVVLPPRVLNVWLHGRAPSVLATARASAIAPARSAFGSTVPTSDAPLPPSTAPAASRTLPVTDVPRETSRRAFGPMQTLPATPAARPLMVTVPCPSSRTAQSPALANAGRQAETTRVRAMTAPALTPIGAIFSITSPPPPARPASVHYAG